MNSATKVGFENWKWLLECRVGYGGDWLGSKALDPNKNESLGSSFDYVLRVGEAFGRKFWIWIGDPKPLKPSTPKPKSLNP